MRMVCTLLALSIAASSSPALATTVVGNFSGTVNRSTTTGVNVGDTFTGSVSYDDGAVVIANGGYPYAMTSGNSSIIVNGLTYSSAVGSFQQIGNSQVLIDGVNGTLMQTTYLLSGLNLPIFPFGTTLAQSLDPAALTGVIGETYFVSISPDFESRSIIDGTISSFSFASSELAPAVPEPSTWAMMLLGFGGIGFAMRRRSRRSALVPQTA